MPLCVCTHSSTTRVHIALLVHHACMTSSHALPCCQANSSLHLDRPPTNRRVNRLMPSSLPDESDLLSLALCCRFVARPGRDCVRVQSSRPEAISNDSQSNESYPVTTCDARGSPSVPMWPPRGSQLRLHLEHLCRRHLLLMPGHKR